MRLWFFDSPLVAVSSTGTTVSSADGFFAGVTTLARSTLAATIGFASFDLTEPVSSTDFFYLLIGVSAAAFLTERSELSEEMELFLLTFLAVLTGTLSHSSCEC